MNNLKKYAKPVGILAGSLFIYILMLSVLHYFGIAKLRTIGNINFVVMAIIMFLGGVFLGKKTSKKGYLEGLKLGGFLVVIMLIINLVAFRHFDLYVVLYYLVLIASSVIGSMIGINLHH